MTTSDYFPVNTGVRQGCALVATLFNTCMDDVLRRMLEKSGFVVSFGIVRITDHDFADDALLFAETTKVLPGTLESLSEEADLLGLRGSWIRTKVLAFGDILNATVVSITVYK